MHYEHHIEFPFPTHGVTDCESCHVADTNNVPDQSKSLPGLLSASDQSLAGTEKSVMYRRMSPVPLHEPVVDATGRS